MNNQQNNQVAAIQEHKLNLFFEDYPVRMIIDDDGGLWFVARDVCDVLEIGNITEALRSLDDDELTSVELKSGGQTREMKIVSEPGFYSLVGKSRKPQAKTFKRWVNHEVLPSIRKTGSYSLAEGALPAAFTPAQEEHIRETATIAVTCALQYIQARYRLTKIVKPVTRHESDQYHHLLLRDRSVGSIARQFERSPSTVRRHTKQLRSDLRVSQGGEA